MRRSLRQIREDDAYEVLKVKGPMRASDFGWAMWGDTTEVPDRGEGSHRQNKFCRSAGKLLRRLQARGLAHATSEPGYRLWHANENQEGK